MDQVQGAQQQQEQNKDKDVPDGWKLCFSKTQNKEYYFHPATGRSVWKLEDISIMSSNTSKGSASSDSSDKGSHSASAGGAAVSVGISNNNNTSSFSSSSNDQTNDSSTAAAAAAVKRRRGVGYPGSSSSASSKEADTSLPITSSAITSSQSKHVYVAGGEELSKEEQERKYQLEQFRESALSRIKAFHELGEEKKLIFEPCNSERRYLICEAADDLGLMTKEKSTIEDVEDAKIALIGRAIDDEEVKEEEKFIVVYAQGYISEDEEENQQSNLTSEKTYIKPKKTKRPTIYDKPPPLDPNSLTNLNVVKRDRRSVEEIQRDLEREKRRQQQQRLQEQQQ